MSLKKKLDEMIAKSMKEAYPVRHQVSYEDAKKIYLKIADDLLKMRKEIAPMITGTIIASNFDELINSLKNFHKD